MIDAFKALGLSPRLDLADDSLRQAFRAASKHLHPDAGGGEAEFSALNEAFVLLSSPSRRLRHWLELQGLSADPRGSIEPALMELFSEVGAATQKAEATIRRRDAAMSALGRAMLEQEIQSSRDAIEAVNIKVEQWISRQCEHFSEFEKTTSHELAHVSQIIRNLVFLEKWRTSLRGIFSSLV